MKGNEALSFHFDDSVLKEAKNRAVRLASFGDDSIITDMSQAEKSERAFMRLGIASLIFPIIIFYIYQSIFNFNYKSEDKISNWLFIIASINLFIFGSFRFPSNNISKFTRLAVIRWVGITKFISLALFVFGIFVIFGKIFGYDIEITISNDLKIEFDRDDGWGILSVSLAISLSVFFKARETAEYVSTALRIFKKHPFRFWRWLRED